MDREGNRLLRALEENMLAKIDLLTQEECSAIRATLHELKKLWIQRHPVLPFYTLGAASPYDIPINRQDYYKKAKVLNFVLNSRFQWLYKLLANALGNHLQNPTFYPENLALPGFQIFLSDKAFEQPMGAIHCEKSYMFHWQSLDEVSFDNPISFTLAICLPQLGGEMYMWDLDYSEVKGLNHSEIENIARTKQKSFYPHEVGKLTIHSGLRVHQIAPGKNLQIEDERITFQGHALFCHGC